jgi:hypothetical protein
MTMLIPRQREQGEMVGVPVHRFRVRRRGDPPWSDVAWRTYCESCKEHWRSEDGSQQGFADTMAAISLHRRTGGWPPQPWHLRETG